MHTVWKGSLSLGLLNIGIRLYSAVEEKIEKQEQNKIISPTKNIINIMETLNASIEQVKQKKEKNKGGINEQKAT
jgi:DNA end-binding protein Ku